MRVKLVPETKPEEMNESQWTSRRGSRPALRTTSFALPYCDSRHDGLIRLAPALKGRLARYHARRSRVGARTYRPRRRMIAQLIEGKECAGTWRVLPTMSAAPHGAAECVGRLGAPLRADNDIKREMISFVPSCNTDQGAFYSREYWRDENLNAQWKWWWEKDSCAGASSPMHFLPILKLVKLETPRAPPVFSIDLSRIWNTGTRKRMNYSCAGWSQWKHWWRAKAVLTCKLFVRHVNSGERPIESSNSWFLPKFP